MMLFSLGCASFKPWAQKSASPSRSISGVDDADSTRSERQRAAIEDLLNNVYLFHGYEKIRGEFQPAPNEETSYGGYVLKSGDKYVYVVVRAIDISFESGDAATVTSGVRAVASISFSTPDLDSKFKPRSFRPVTVEFFPRTDSDPAELRQTFKVKFELDAEAEQVSRSLEVLSSDIARSAGPHLSLSTEYENLSGGNNPRFDKISCFVKPQNDNATYKLIARGAEARVDDWSGREEKPLNDWVNGDFNSLYSECFE